MPPSDTDIGADDSNGPSAVGPSLLGLGPALRSAWVAYQVRLDTAMAEAGYGERRFPDGRVFRLCLDQSGSTISAIGRELGITRQGASKVVGQLRESGLRRGHRLGDQREGKVGHPDLPVELTTSRHNERRLGPSRTSWRPRLEGRGFPACLPCSTLSTMAEQVRLRSTFDVRPGYETHFALRQVSRHFGHSTCLSTYLPTYLPTYHRMTGQPACVHGFPDHEECLGLAAEAGRSLCRAPGPNLTLLGSTTGGLRCCYLLRPGLFHAGRESTAPTDHFPADRR